VANAQMKKLRHKWADARRQFEDSIKTASSAADTVRTGLGNALDDLRKALLESKSKLTSSAGRLPSRRVDVVPGPGQGRWSWCGGA
jgi:hypothetical protein